LGVKGGRGRKTRRGRERESEKEAGALCGCCVAILKRLSLQRKKIKQRVAFSFFITAKRPYHKHNAMPVRPVMTKSRGSSWGRNKTITRGMAP
jgi:hypothetical protein